MSFSFWFFPGGFLFWVAFGFVGVSGVGVRPLGAETSGAMSRHALREYFLCVIVGVS